MNISQSQSAEEKPHAVLPSNPFIPPEGDICYINDLPPELLSRIFEAGFADDDNEDEDDIEADLWEDFRHEFEDSEKDSGEQSPCNGDVEMNEEHEDEEETDDSDDSDVTGSSDSRSQCHWGPFTFVASQVCRHWRNVAVSTPSLWTTILVSARSRPPYEYQSMLLERSKSLLIDIYVDCDPFEDHSQVYRRAPSLSDLTSLYSMLIPHVHRWRTIEVTVPNYNLMHAFLTAVSNPVVSGASQLTTLELYDHEDIESYETFKYPQMARHFVLFGGSAPSLNRIILWGVHVDWNQSWIASASNLTELELAYHPEDVRPSWAQFVTILRGAMSLEQLSLRLSGPLEDPQDWFIEPTPGSPADLNAPIQLPRVRDFILAFQSQARAIALIRKLNLPELKHLTLDFDDGDYTDLVHELAKANPTSSYFTREPPRSLLSKLDAFKIAGLPCRSDCIQTLYGELQNLTSLNISLTHLDPLFLDILCTPCALAGRGDIWLPRLEKLYVSGASGLSLREVVKQRRDAGVPLNALYVEETSDVEKEDAEWLKLNVKTFEFFEGSDDEDEFEDLEEVNEWFDTDD